MSDLRICAFSERGMRLAYDLAGSLGGQATRIEADRHPTLDEWTAANFAAASRLIFIGAVGIAVRAIAPYITSKMSDPAVVAVDEAATFAVALLSGHTGGANELARQVAEACGAEAVITTATDVNGVFAVDDWVRAQGCTLLNPPAVKSIARKMLLGNTVYFRSDWHIRGAVPPGVAEAHEEEPAFIVSIRTPRDAASCRTPLFIIPRIAVLGVGCCRGTSVDVFEALLADVLETSHLSEQAIEKVATIDIKRDEEGLLAFCERHGWPLETFSAEELAAVPGVFSSSDFVEQTTGVDNVCERAAVAASDGGMLEGRKYAANGVTMAYALRRFEPDWSCHG